MKDQRNVLRISTTTVEIQDNVTVTKKTVMYFIYLLSSVPGVKKIVLTGIIDLIVCIYVDNILLFIGVDHNGIKRLMF